MSGRSRTIVLRSADARATIIPDEGGVATELIVAGAACLARTPWADRVSAHDEPAHDEAEWVRRWRGGWQLCFPTAGRAEPGSHPPQAFHGTASQASWVAAEVSDTHAALEWTDALGLAARRDWMLRPEGLDVTTRARNHGEISRTLSIAEHLVLGSEFVAPALTGAELSLEAPAGTLLAPLAYDGSPAGIPTPWPGDPDAPWDRIDATSPARVAALLAPKTRAITVAGPALTAIVTWDGLPHALLWEELAASSEHPWNGEVVALGIEPTSTPHGAGTGSGDGGEVTLAPGEELTWSVSLRITATAPPGPDKEEP